MPYPAVHTLPFAVWLAADLGKTYTPLRARWFTTNNPDEVANHSDDHCSERTVFAPTRT